MRKSLLLLLIVLFSSCSDNYDKSLKEKSSYSYTPEDISKTIDDIKKTNDVVLSSETEEKITNLQDKLDKVSNQEIDDTIASIKQDIEDSNLSVEEKESALNKINKLEKDKIKEELNKIVPSNNQTEEENCDNTIDNRGAVPPSLPSDTCLKGVQ